MSVQARQFLLMSFHVVGVRPREKLRGGAPSHHWGGQFPAPVGPSGECLPGRRTAHWFLFIRGPRFLHYKTAGEPCCLPHPRTRFPLLADLCVGGKRSHVVRPLTVEPICRWYREHRSLESHQEYRSNWCQGEYTTGWTGSGASQSDKKARSLHTRNPSFTGNSHIRRSVYVGTFSVQTCHVTRISGCCTHSL
jgi:hypothetical protein